MYLAMARVAFREGYPEIGLYYEKAAFEEAEHAAKFAELLGEVLTDSTKKNLAMRVEAVQLDGLPAVRVAALQDNDVPVVGTTSYGKGTVQSSYQLGDGSYVKLTTNKFFTPKGKEIQDHGVTPDYPVAMDMVYRMTNLRFTGTLELGSEALHVYQLQVMLAAMNYFTAEASGIYDQATVEAVAAFQQANGLSPSGNMDRETTDLFNQRWEKHAVNSDIQLNKAIEVLDRLLKGN